MKKRIIAFACVLALLLGTPIASVEAASASDTYRVGFSKVNVTPVVDPNNPGLPMGGYGDQDNRKAITVMTPQFLKSQIAAGNSKFEKSSAASIPTNANPEMFNLFTSCTAITDQADTTILLMTMDVISISSTYSLPMRQAVSDATGVPVENIIINHSHSHSTPVISTSSYAQNVAWRENIVVPGMVQAAKEAMANRSEATMYEGSVNAPGTASIRHYYTSTEDKPMLDDEGNRHVEGSNFGSMYGSGLSSVIDPDEDINLLMFKMEDPSKKDVLLCNYRVHPCRDSSSGAFDHDDHQGYRAVSSDYVGPLRDALEQQGYDFAYFQGAAGNVASKGSLSSYHYGIKLAEFTIKGLSNLTQVNAGPIQVQQHNMSGNAYQPDPADVEPAKKVRALYNELLDGDPTISDPELNSLFHSATYIKKSVNSDGSVKKTTAKVDSGYTSLNSSTAMTATKAHTLASRLAWSFGLGSRYHANNIVNNANASGTKNIPLYAFTLGEDIAIVTNPNEIFSDLTQELVHYYGKRTYVFSYTNGSQGYLPNVDSFHYNATKRADGTIAYGGSYETHVTDFAMGTGDKVVATLKAMLDNVRVPESCPCMGAHTDPDDCTTIAWEPWTSATSLPSFGNYYLATDVTVTAPTQLQGKLNLDLRGKTVTGSGGCSIYTVSSRDHLTITDSYAGGQLGTSGVPIQAYPEGTLTVYGVTVGGSVKVDGAQVTLAGDPTINLNLSDKTAPMDCTLLHENAKVYVIAPAQACFATVSSSAQIAAITMANGHSIHADGNKLYVTTKQVHCVCCGRLSGQYGHVCQQLTWQPWTSSDSLPTSTGNYYLTGTVYLDKEQAIAADATVRLDLNGYTVYAGQQLDDSGNRQTVANPTRAYYVPTGSTLEITSTTGGGTLNGSVTAPAATDRNTYGGVIYADEGSVLRLYKGTIVGHRSNTKCTVNRGGCVYAMGEFTMYDGAIQNGAVTGTNKRGGNVYAKNFTMYGGSITNGMGTGINLYVDKDFSAHIGGTAYIYSGITVVSGASVKLSGAPHIPSWTYSSGSSSGIKLPANVIVDATELDVEAMKTITPPDNAETRHINILGTVDSAFASVKKPAQAQLFVSHKANTAIRYDAEGKLYLYDTASGIRYGCYCSEKHIGAKNHTCDPTIAWTPWTNAQALPTEGNYYLTGDVTVSDITYLTADLNLDLNGKTIYSTGKARALHVPAGMTFRVTDSGEGGKIDASQAKFEYEYTYDALMNTPDNAGGVMRVEGTFELYGGSLIGAQNVARAGVIHATGSSSKKAYINIYGGTITGSSVINGGGIYLYYTTLKMYGGEIRDCTSARGGSIYATSSSTAYIYGGTVTGGHCAPADFFKQDAETGEYTVPTLANATGGNIYANSSSIYIEGGTVSSGSVIGDNANGGNLYGSSSGKYYIRSGIVEGGNAANMGGNMALMSGSTSTVSGGIIRNGGEGYNIGLWSSCTLTISGGHIYGSKYAVYNGTTGGKTVLSGNPRIEGDSYGIYMGSAYINNGTSEAPAYELNTAKLATLEVKNTFAGTVTVVYGNTTAELLNIAQGAEIENTKASAPFPGQVLWSSKQIPLMATEGKKLSIASVGIADGDGIVANYANFAAALEAYELQDSQDQSYILAHNDLAEIDVTKDVYLDLNGHNVSVKSVAEGCQIYAMDSVTNQYTHQDLYGNDLCGKLTLATGVEDSALAKNVQINLTKGDKIGFRKYLALAKEGEYTFHRYYLSLNEVGLRPSDAGIFYNAEFYGDEAVAAAVTNYGVEVSSKSTFDTGFTARSNYQKDLGAFQPGVVGNYGYRTVLTNILSKNGAGKVNDYSNRTVYGRAYLTVGDQTLYCTEVGSTTLRSILKKADASYGNNALSDAQVKALDEMYNTYSNVMDSWNILDHIGRVDVDIEDLFIPDPKADDELNILLIGNSFCSYWVDELYGLLADGSGYAPEKINITNVYYSGCPLKNHWNWLESGAANYNISVTTHTGRDYDKTVFYDLNAVVTGKLAKSWDFISLQQNSPAFYNGEYMGDLDYARKTLEPYLGNLLNYLKSNYPKAEYMWHQFWAHEVGHMNTDKTETIVNNIAERDAFHNAMVAIGSEVSQLYGMTIVPTGEAWELVRDNALFTTSKAPTKLSKFTLCTRIYNGNIYDDLYHDGDIGGGQFLNACVWYEMITGKSVLDTKWTPTYELSGVNYNLSTSQVNALKNAAHQAVAQYNP